jgi:hypothetical protein
VGGTSVPDPANVQAPILVGLGVEILIVHPVTTAFSPRNAAE